MVDLHLREECLEVEDPLFALHYGGVVNMCNQQRPEWSPLIVRGEWDWGSSANCDRDDEDMWIQGFDGVSMETFHNKKICGLRGGSSYADVIRPNLETGMCPGEMVPCATETSVENTICREPTDLEKCPITDLKFVDASSEIDYTNLGY